MTGSRNRTAALFCCLGLMLPLSCAAEDLPDAGIGIDEHLGRAVPSNLVFTDENGASVTLAQILAKGKPILLIPAYYGCPMLCGLVMGSTIAAAHEIDWQPGIDYFPLVVSFNREDTPIDASRKQNAELGKFASDPRFAYGRWPFLCADQPTIDLLLSAIGERIQRDEQQIRHPAIQVVLTPDGHISRYLYGIDVPPHDLKLALLEASAGRSGSAFDRILMFCYRYDPATRRYGFFITGFLKIGAVLILLGGGLLVTMLVLRISDRTRIRNASRTEQP